MFLRLQPHPSSGKTPSAGHYTYPGSESWDTPCNLPIPTGQDKVSYVSNLVNTAGVQLLYDSLCSVESVDSLCFWAVEKRGQLPCCQTVTAAVPQGLLE